MILSLDSTTTVCSVALHHDGKLMEAIFISEPRAASSRLLVEAKNLLEKNSIKPIDLKAIAVSSGPGSYTGLRISTSAAKGLCYALNIPLISVNSLLVLTYPITKTHPSDLFCPMLDARRLEVYTCLLDPNLTVAKPIEAKVLDPDSFSFELQKNKITFFGDGSLKFKEIINHPNALFVDGVQPEAKNLGYLAHEKLLNNDFENVEQFEPMYLKDFMVKKKALKPTT
jgi:tRNA threonylcarbamoyladenosine biosynthesis protein TsaB